MKRTLLQSPSNASIFVFLLHAIWITLALHSFAVEAKITFYSPSQLEGLSIHATQFMFLGPSEKMHMNYSRLVASDPRGGCSWGDVKNKDDWKDNIVMVDRVNGHCSPVDQFRTAQKGGAKAIVVLISPTDFAITAASNYQHSGGVHVSGVEVQPSSKKDYDDIWKYAGSSNSSLYVNVTIDGDGPKLNEGYYIACSVLTGTFAVVNFGLAVFKMHGFVRKHGVEASLPQVCLAIELAGNIFRIILSLESDVGQGRGILDYTSILFIQFCIVPCTLITTLMIAFYWDRSLKGFTRKIGAEWNVMSIERWKIPLIVICVLLVLLSLIQATLVALWYGSKSFAVIIFIITSASIFGIAVFFAVKGNKVLKWTKNTLSITEKSQKITKMTYFVVANTAGLFSSVVFELTLIVSSLGGWIPLLLSLNFVSFCQIMIFQPYSHGFSSSSGNTGSKSGSTVTMSTLNTQPATTTTTTTTSTTTSSGARLSTSDNSHEVGTLL